MLWHYWGGGTTRCVLIPSANCNSDGECMPSSMLELNEFGMVGMSENTQCNNYKTVAVETRCGDTSL